jgi:hypothetical protein
LADVRAAHACALVLIAFTGCGSTGDEPDREGRAGDEAARVERCTDRLLERADLAQASPAKRAATRRYVETTYCTRFESRGWVYDDGALAIDAHLALVTGGACAVGGPDGSARRVPCDEVDRGHGPQQLECAILHHVPRSEVRTYVRELRRDGAVECDDGTPLDELGAR